MKDFTYQIKDFAKVKGGKRLSVGYFVQDDKTDYPYIRVSDMNFNSLDTSDVKYITDEVRKKIKRYTISSDDVYISIAGTIGLIGKIPKFLDGANLTENSAKITQIDKSKVVQDYLLYYLRSWEGQAQIKARVGGASQPKLALSRIETIEIPALSLNLQRGIKHVLTSISRLIELNNEKIIFLEEMAQLLYREWFVEFRFPGYEKHKFVDSELGKIPEGWILEKIGHRVKVRRGRTITNKMITEGNVPVVAGGLEPAYYHNVPNVNAPVVTISASGANSGYVNLYSVDIWASDCSYISKKQTRYIYYYYLQLKIRQYEVTNLQMGAAQPHVYAKDIMDLETLYPGEDFIKEFENIIGPMLELIDKLTTMNNNLSKTRDLLLPKLMSREIDVSKLDINITKN